MFENWGMTTENSSVYGLEDKYSICYNKYMQSKKAKININISAT